MLYLMILAQANVIETESFNPVQLADKMTTVSILLVFLWFVIRKWNEDLRYYREREANLWNLLIEFIKGKSDHDDA